MLRFFTRKHYICYTIRNIKKQERHNNIIIILYNTNSYASVRSIVFLPAENMLCTSREDAFRGQMTNEILVKR